MALHIEKVPEKDRTTLMQVEAVTGKAPALRQ